MTVTLRPSHALPRVYLYREPIDFRKSYKGLSALIQLELGHNPFSGELYAFINKHHNKIKLIFWEHNGFVLYYKALVEEKFCWPKRTDEVVVLTGEQLNWLLDGMDVFNIKKHKKLHFESII